MHRPPPDFSEDESDITVARGLDDRLAELLAAIETERVPDRLQRLARQLQDELALRKRRGRS